MKNIVISILFLALAVSCDTKFYANGRIVDKTTKLPLENVMISVKYLDTIYTNSNGQFHVDTFIHRHAGDFEILLEKQGYQTTHINFNKIQRKKEYLFEMDKLQHSEAPFCLKRQKVWQMYYFNKFILSAFNFFTLAFMLFVKFRRKLLWITGVLILNPTLFLSVADCCMVKYSILNGPVYLTHYNFHPFAVKIVLPVVTCLFWGLWFWKRKWFFKSSFRSNV